MVARNLYLTSVLSGWYITIEISFLRQIINNDISTIKFENIPPPIFPVFHALLSINEKCLFI